MVIGDNEELEKLAEQYLETYELEDILNQNNLSSYDVVYYLLLYGLIDPEMPHVV